jgi:hypothetical protein
MKDSIYNPEGDGGMDILLWEFIDGSCNESEKTAIEKLIAENIEWKAKYHELLEVHQLIGATDLDAPSMRFTKNVMEEIAKNHIAPATNQYINNKIIWGIAAFFITVIVSFVIYGFSQVDWSVPQGKIICNTGHGFQCHVQQYLCKCIYDDQCYFRINVV